MAIFRIKRSRITKAKSCKTRLILRYFVFLKFSPNFQAICFTRRIGDNHGPAFSGKFTCALYNCPGCHHSVFCGENVVGFPFELEEEIGKGGFASVYRGKFHQGKAAFKFVQIKDEQTYTYDRDAVGCYEYYQQKRVMKFLI